MTREEQLRAFLDRSPYLRFLGMTAGLAGDEVTSVLPFSPHLIGNTLLPSLHGGGGSPTSRSRPGRRPAASPSPPCADTSSWRRTRKG